MTRRLEEKQTHLKQNLVFAGLAGTTYQLLSVKETLMNVQMVKRGDMISTNGTRFLLPQYNGDCYLDWRIWPGARWKPSDRFQGTKNEVASGAITRLKLAFLLICAFTILSYS